MGWDRHARIAQRLSGRRYADDLAGGVNLQDDDGDVDDFVGMRVGPGGFRVDDANAPEGAVTPRRQREVFQCRYPAQDADVRVVGGVGDDRPGRDMAKFMHAHSP